MKTKLFFIVVFALAGLAIYLYIVKSRRSTGIEEYDLSTGNDPVVSSFTSSSASSPAPSVQESHNPNAIVKRGSRGINVEYVQKAINRVLRDKGETQLVTDGIFGSKTEAALYKLTGKKLISYASMKAFVIKYFTNQGKPNPYVNNSSESASTASSNSDYSAMMSLLTLGISDIF